jgi:hypothetical protein
MYNITEYHRTHPGYLKQCLPSVPKYENFLGWGGVCSHVNSCILESDSVGVARDQVSALSKIHLGG